LEIPVIPVPHTENQDITHWENCDAGVRIEERIFRDNVDWNVID
jgi:hypothetical protein